MWQPLLFLSFHQNQNKRMKTQQFCRLTEKKCSNFFLYLKTSCLERKNSFFQSFFFVDSHHTTHTHKSNPREREKNRYLQQMMMMIWFRFSNMAITTLLSSSSSSSMIVWHLLPLFFSLDDDSIQNFLHHSITKNNNIECCENKSRKTRFAHKVEFSFSFFLLQMMMIQTFLFLIMD